MAEYLRIASSEQAMTKTNQPMVKVHLADGTMVICFDTALFPKILGQAAINAEVDRSQPRFPKITAVVAGGPVPSANGSPVTGPSERDHLIMRQVALKAAVDAAPHLTLPSTTVSEHLALVRQLADGYLEWLENPTPF